jgi:hypothetical protein
MVLERKQKVLEMDCLVSGKYGSSLPRSDADPFYLGNKVLQLRRSFVPPYCTSGTVRLAGADAGIAVSNFAQPVYWHRHVKPPRTLKSG